MASNIEKLEELTTRLESLRKQEVNEYQFFFENTYALLAVYDDQRRAYIRANKAFIDALGVTEKEFCERRIDEFLHPDDLALAKERRKLFDMGAKVLTFHIRYKHKNGSYIPITVTCGPATRGYMCVIGKVEGASE